jgi:hypothetical protein
MLDLSQILILLCIIMDIRLPTSSREMRPHSQTQSRPEQFSRELVFGLLHDLTGTPSEADMEQAHLLIAEWESAQGSKVHPNTEKAPSAAEKLTALIKDHGLIADKVRTWMQSRGRWPSCEDVPQRSTLPDLPSGPSETDRHPNPGLPISDTIATHVDYIMAHESAAPLARTL